MTHEEKKEYYAAYRKANKLKRREYDKTRYQLNREEIITNAIARQKANKKAHNEYVAQYAERNPDMIHKAQRNYLKNHKGTIPYIQRNMLTRAKRRANAGTYPFDITIEDIQSVWPMDGKCPVLGIDLDLSGVDLQRTASLDKINPRLGYVKGNILVVSFRANSIKKDSTLEEMRMLLTFYENKINQIF